MKKLSSQHYLLLILSILALFAAVAAYIFMYKDAVKKAEGEANVRAQVSTASEQTLEAKNMETIYKDTITNRAILPSFLVSVDNAVPFINAVEAIGPVTGATISISSLSSGMDNDSSHNVVTATISAVGAWANVMRAVQIVENMPYAISIKSLNMDVSSPNWTAVLDVSVLSSP